MSSKPTLPSLSGWGRVFSPGVEKRSTDLEALTKDAVLTRGLGRSYGGSSLPPPSVGVVVATGALESATQITAEIVLSGLVLHDPAGDVNAELPNAEDLAAAMGVATVAGRSVRFVHRNTADAAETITVTPGTGVTISGTATIAQNNSKEWLLVFDSPTAYTAYSLGSSVF